MRLCSYIITNDTGFAPNPFGGYCTLAACTPNHRGVRLTRGDWVVGHETLKLGRGLIYAMQVSEVLDFDDYYKDPRFQHKKPRFDESWREACGENAPKVPERFTALLWNRQGCKCSHSGDPVRGFLEWLRESFEPGVHGDPQDRWWVDAISNSRRLYPLGRRRGKRSVLS